MVTLGGVNDEGLIRRKYAEVRVLPNGDAALCGKTSQFGWAFGHPLRHVAEREAT
jgi:hypothetical protein